MIVTMAYNKVMNSWCSSGPSYLLRTTVTLTYIVSNLTRVHQNVRQFVYSLPESQVYLPKIPFSSIRTVFNVKCS